MHFTIDLERALIYNADSLPKGTDISRLLVTLQSSGANVEFNVKNGAGRFFGNALQMAALSPQA